MVRKLACEALGRMERSEAVPRLFDVLADEDVRVAHAATEALVSIVSPETEALAIEAARSRHPRVRRGAFRVIAACGYTAAADVVLEALNDPDAQVREAAILGLPFIEDPRARWPSWPGRGMPISAARRCSAWG